MRGWLPTASEEPIRKSWLNEDQMGKILCEADKTPVVEVAKKRGIAEQTIHVWRQRFGRLELADAKWLRRLEQENGRLKKIVAERDLEIEVMKGIAQKDWQERRCGAARRRLRGRGRGASPQVEATGLLQDG